MLVAPLSPTLEQLNASIDGQQLLLLHAFHGSFRLSTGLISAGELGVVAVATPDGSLTVLVINTTTNAPVSNASISIYKHLCWSRCRPRDVTLHVESWTDASGLSRIANVQQAEGTSEPRSLLVQLGSSRCAYTLPSS